MKDGDVLKVTPGHRVLQALSQAEAELYKLARKERVGTVVSLSDTPGRAMVRWDDDQEHPVWHNLKPLTVIPPKRPNPFCSYCLRGLRPGDPIVLNSENGVAVHTVCARVISETLARMEKPA